ncbi:MAG TPA: FAD-binding protein [Solirubrobacteraceae bacterium]
MLDVGRGEGIGAAARGDLEAILGDRFSTSDSVRDIHGRDESAFDPVAPDAVAFPGSTEEVVGIVRACVQHGIPIVPFGEGSSLEGHVLPVAGGLTVDLGGMDRVLEMSMEDLDCRVEAGVRRRALEERLGREGLFFPVDPGADASLGGMAATGASGLGRPATGRCARTCSGSRSCWPTGPCCVRAHAPGSPRPATT